MSKMNIKYIFYLISGLFSSFLFFSCDNDDNNTSYTSLTNDAQIYSFSISGTHDISLDSVPRAHDSIRYIQINKTKFAINQVSGVIYNPDSMPYGTVLKKVLMTTTYNPTYGVSKVMITTPDSIKGYVWNTTDSVDFSKTPITFEVTPVSNQNPKVYTLDLRIHKVDPDTIVWRQSASYPSAIGQSKTILQDNIFYTYSVNNGSVSLYTSDKESMSWTKETLSGLPTTLNTESVFALNSVFYALDANGNAYQSADGKSWNSVSNGKNLTSVLGIVPGADRSDDLLLVVINDGGKYYFGKTKDMATIEVVQYVGNSPTNNEIASNFPIHNGASYTNFNTDKRYQMLIVTGGISSTNEELSNTWLIKNTEEGLDITPFVTNSFFKGDGLSVFRYNELLYTLSDNVFYTSSEWGRNWKTAASKEMLPAHVSKRSGQTVIVDNENNIWVFGGISETGVSLTDVWSGRLNKLNP